MNQDIMHCLSVDQWAGLKEVFRNDWPRGITGYYAVDTLSKWMNLGLNYGFKVLNPFGKPENGMIAVIKDETEFIEMLIECPQDDTSKLEEALKRTQLIDWSREIVVLFPPRHVVEGVKRIAGDIKMEVQWIHPLKLYILSKESPLYDVWYVSHNCIG
uniref:Uncharacterized protein n=1 Tax=Pectinophora gossypiella TaxID=13191 RepID=A0A1E1WIB5_PECGO